MRVLFLRVNHDVRLFLAARESVRQSLRSSANTNVNHLKSAVVDIVLGCPRAGRPCLRLSITKNLVLPSDTDCHSHKCKKNAAWASPSRASVSPPLLPPRASSILCRSEDPALASRLWQRARRTVPPKPAESSAAPATERPIAPEIPHAAAPIPESTGPSIAQWHLCAWSIGQLFEEQMRSFLSFPLRRFGASSRASPKH